MQEDTTTNIEVPNPSIKKRQPPKHIPFWSDNPNVLFQKDYILEFFPVNTMSYEQKLNAVTRTILILTIVGYIITRNLRIMIVSGLTLLSIFILHYYQGKEKKKTEDNKVKEGFANPTTHYLDDNHISIPKDVFMLPKSDNPFSNVLITDYDYNPDKKPAPPSFNSNVNTEILEQAKKLVSEANPDQPDIADKLFKGLGEQLVFEQSLRPFTSNPSTTIPNDQGAFADFCYGSMISCKEGNQFACARNLSRYTNV